LSSTKIVRLAWLRSIRSGDGYPATVPAGAVSWSLGVVGGLGEEAKPLPHAGFMAAFPV